MSVEALDSLAVAEPETGAFARAGVLRRLARDRVAAGAALTLTFIVLAALFAPWIAPHDPYFTDLTKVMQPPSDQHWFGTDNTGRDVLSRIIFGTRATLMLGLVGVIVGGLIGGVLGILAAYYRKLDGWIMRLVDVMLAFPAILIGLAVAAIFGAGLTASSSHWWSPPYQTSRGWRGGPPSASWVRNSWRPGARSASPTER